MSKDYPYPLRINLTAAELRALANILDLAFVGDDSDLAGVVGGHHAQLAAAKRMRIKVWNAIMLAKGSQ